MESDKTKEQKVAPDGTKVVFLGENYEIVDGQAYREESSEFYIHKLKKWIEYKKTINTKPMSDKLRQSFTKLIDYEINNCEKKLNNIIGGKKPKEILNHSHEQTP